MESIVGSWQMAEAFPAALFDGSPGINVTPVISIATIVSDCNRRLSFDTSKHDFYQFRICDTALMLPSQAAERFALFSESLRSIKTRDLRCAR